jgi:hypothetical protein
MANAIVAKDTALNATTAKLVDGFFRWKGR